MKQMLFWVSLVLLACSESQIEPITFQPINKPSNPQNLPAELVGVYYLDQVLLQGSTMEVSYGEDPKVTVTYTHNDDITEMVKEVLFNAPLATTIRNNCLPNQLGVSFDSDGRTSYVCIERNIEKVSMGYWNTTGYDNSLLAWSLFIYPEAIECEIVPFEASRDRFEGYVVFPLPNDGTQPFLENGNRQYRKIKIVLRKA